MSQGISEPAELQARWTLSSDVGGRILRDKLWFYVGGTRNVNTETVLDVYQPDGSPAVDDKTSDWFNGKVNYQASHEPQVRRLRAVSAERRDPQRDPVRAVGVAHVPGA